MNDKVAATAEQAKVASPEKKRVLPDLSAQAKADKARIAELEAALAAEKAKKLGGFGVEMSGKGCVVIRLGGGFPISLYLDKLDVLLGNVDELRAFVDANRNRIKKNKGA